MFTKFSLSMLAIILLTGLAGCAAINTANPSSSEAANSTQSGASGAITETASEDNYQMLPIISGKLANMKLDASASGSTQQLKRGEVMSIALESNPSTGFAWVANISNTAAVIQMGEPEYTEPTPSTTPLVGAAGTQTFFFQAVGAGTATITLDYKQSWATDVPPAQTVTIIVNVK